MRKVEAIDLFCGIGGLTCGLQQVDIKVIAGLDNDKSCQYSYEKNNNVDFICKDVTKYDFREMKDMYSKDSIKVLVGCAPCQTFSSHTFKVRNREDDIRWNMIDHFLRGIKEIKPDIISMENVRGITKTEIFFKFVEQVKKLGYKISYEVVNFADYGVPQNRNRLVFLASKLGEIFIPIKTHSKKNRVTIKGIIKKLPKIKSGEVYKNDKTHTSRNLSKLNIQRIKQSNPGGTWQDWDNELLLNCYKKESGQTYSTVYGRMSWDKVSPTITTQFSSYGSGRFGHPEQDRAISIREGALLQTFPMDYDFGKEIRIVEVSRHIGNAVPPKMGKNIGICILRHLEEVEYGKK
ncbi:DNA cytosine methyltransferase [Bathymodiolus azoricus thioautotrophic gill symbiont]|jgi:DNA (cytosine-5)-methyltransferase 1|uniref:Cytosine-specific methyltransferase n=1 Tax=Bathymodiolus azoricus thioautotrophic gill symbiont TaxID=235205 RepID=A0A1H6JCL6_9GAMM|nr:DNA (cytosine-5-)-methyltransferase [Bathymodiolus azoricus thioautotrophic gill symbiont]CAC9531210.1 DNA-cytosine methyltransferase (EC 2.1.1.37) [uncultured Gammaproteobacteria bacterium]CAC9984107.1 DNA-cytosine methyltransferase (EC 2.1.1.37) [uncultured Gammaproteobacteria bacterium]SEH59585.1 modification methylase [Bathymodiolus azoricus thioautotrophic gill symbiont]VVH56764.1 DNA-cytosine methyltransferase (EC [uncultured Gammaproteobacteria bacterium]